MYLPECSFTFFFYSETSLFKGMSFSMKSCSQIQQFTQYNSYKKLPLDLKARVEFIHFYRTSLLAHLNSSTFLRRSVCEDWLRSIKRKPHPETLMFFSEIFLVLCLLISWVTLCLCDVLMSQEDITNTVTVLFHSRKNTNKSGKINKRTFPSNPLHVILMRSPV